MKKCIRLIIALLLLYFGYQSSFAQSFAGLIDAAGFESAAGRLASTWDVLLGSRPGEFDTDAQCAAWPFFEIGGTQIRKA